MGPDPLTWRHAALDKLMQTFRDETTPRGRDTAAPVAAPHPITSTITRTTP